MSYWLKAIELLVYGTLLASMLAFGASFAGGYTVLEGSMLAAALILALYLSLTGWPSVSRAGKIGFIILGIWFCFLCVQLIPIPLTYAEMISPKLIELIRSFSPRPLDPGSWLPIRQALQPLPYS